MLCRTTGASRPVAACRAPSKRTFAQFAVWAKSCHSALAAWLMGRREGQRARFLVLDLGALVDPQRQREGERRALAYLTLDPDSSAMKLDEFS
jgi:hypothetical protein